MCSLNASGILNSSNAQDNSRAQNTGNGNVKRNTQPLTSLPNCSSTSFLSLSSDPITQSKSAIQNDNQATSIGQNPDSMTQSSETRLDEACKTLNEIASQETKLQRFHLIMQKQLRPQMNL